MACKLVTRASWIFLLLAIFGGALVGQTAYPQGGTPGGTQQPTYPQADASGGQGQANMQAVATSGLLPVYGIELRADKSWVDSQFPSQSATFPNSGVSSAFQAAWDSLKASGWNILRVPVDVHDPQSANRLANMCVWARNNNVKILPVLLGATRPDYESKAPALVQAVVSTLGRSQASDAYLQIAAYQLDDEMNHAGVHGPLPPSITQQLARAAQNIRAAEKQALQGSNTEPTPLMASASFDYELIQARAIAGVPFSDAAYQRAYSSLLRFLQPLAQSPDLDLLSVAWFPGTVSAGTVDKPPVLIRRLEADLGGKQIVFTTGFSTAFASADDQKAYYTMTFANLADVRASAGGESPFMGVVFREALNGRNPPTPKGVAERVKTWDWSAKADDLAAMWNGRRRSEEMKWWWEKVQNNMGLATLQTSAGNPQLTAQPAQQALGQIASAVSETDAAMPYPQYPGQDASSAYSGGNTGAYAGGSTGGYPAGSSASGTTSSSGGGGAPGSPAVKDALQARLVGLLDAAIQRVGGQAGGPAAGAAANCYPGSGNPCGRAGQYPGAYPGDSGGYPGQYPNNGQYPGQSQTSQYPNQSYPQGQYDPNQYPSQSYPQGQNQPANQYPDPNAYPNQGYPQGQYQQSSQYPNQSNPQGQYPGSNQYPDPNQQYPGQPGQYPPGSPYPGSDSGNSGAGVGYPGVPGNMNSIPPGTILISPQDVLVQPGSPQAGQPVTLTAQLRNQGSSDATGLIVLASDQANTVFAQADSVNVARGSASPVTLQFVPSEAQASLPLVLHVSDPLGNEIASASLRPITIAPLPAGSGGPTGTVTDPGSAAGVPGDSTAPGGTGQTKFIWHLGAARLAMVHSVAYYFAGEPMPVMANLSNPFSTPMTNIRGTLFVDGVAVRTQTASALLPHQSRSMVFPNVVVSKPGTHEIKVAVETQRGNARPQVSYLVTKTAFYPRSAPPTRGFGTGPGLHPGPGSGTVGALGTAPRVRSFYSPVPPHLQPQTPNSTGGPPSLSARSIAQGNSGPSQSPSLYARSGASPWGSGPRGIGSPGTTNSSRGNAPPSGNGSTSSGPRPNAPRPFVSLNPNEISYGPPTAKPGQAITFSVIVRNSGEVPAQRVSLVLKLVADGRLVAVTQRPIQFSVAPRGAFRATWQAGMPAGKQVQLLAAVAADDDSNPNGKQTSISLRGAAPPRLGSTGIRLQP